MWEILFGLLKGDFINAYPSDALATYWRIWRYHLVNFSNYQIDFSHLRNAPWGLGVVGFTQPLYEFLLSMFSRLPTVALSYNSLILIVYTLSFINSFILLLYLTKRKSGALVGSVIFTTSLFIQWHSIQNLEIALGVSLIPIFLFFLVLFDRGLSNFGSIKSCTIYSLLCSLVFSAIFLISFQMGYLTLIFTFGYLLISLIFGAIHEGKYVLLRRKFFYYLLLAFLMIIFILPSVYPFIQFLINRRINPTAPVAISNFGVNTILDLVAYGARPWDYLMPSIHHPIFGEFVTRFYEYLRNHAGYQYWSTYLPERANYLTIVGISLSSLSIFDLFNKKRRNIDTTRIVLTFLFLLVLMTAVSFPAVISIMGLKSYFPPFYLFNFFPMFRVYARAGAFVLLCASILSAFGTGILLDKIRERVSSPHKNTAGYLMVIILFLTVIFENLNFPPLPVVDVKEIPKIYQWLTAYSGDLIIIEYPKDNSVNDIGGGCPSWLPVNITRDFNGAYELFYQTVHHKRLFGYESLSKEERKSLGDLGVVNSYNTLKKYGVGLVLVHTRDPMIGIHPWPYPQDNPLDACWQRRIMKKPEKVYEGFKKVVEFDDGVVYKVQ